MKTDVALDGLCTVHAETPQESRELEAWVMSWARARGKDITLNIDVMGFEPITILGRWDPDAGTWALSDDLNHLPFKEIDTPPKD